MGEPVFMIQIVWKCDECERRSEAGCRSQPPGHRLPTTHEARQLGLPMHWVGEFGGTFCGTPCMCAWARRRGLMETT